MKRPGLLYFALGITTILSFGAVTNQLVTSAGGIALSDDRIVFPDGSEQTTAAGSVFSSSWTVPTTYTSESIAGREEFTAVLSAPEITQEVLDSGTVLVYARLEGYSTEVWPDGEVGLLPITLMYDFYGLQIDTWSARVTPGSIQIIFKNSEDLYGSIATLHAFRYIVVSGS